MSGGVNFVDRKFATCALPRSLRYRGLESGNGAIVF